MVEIITKHIDTWNDLTNLINENFTYFNSYRFRGHSDSEWKLESTLTRAINRIDDFDNKEKNITKHFQEFKHNLRGRCSFNLNDISENELYAIGQHFGLYTPLLDWTFSPYVGLFFALQGNSVSKKRCLWAVQEDLPMFINNSIEDLSDKIEFVNPLSNDNPRLVSQQGLFLKLPILLSFEELLRKTEIPHIGTFVYKLEFDDKNKEDFLACLNTMNINNLTLFPDLTGSSLHTNYLLEIEPHLLKKRSIIWEEYGSDNKKSETEDS